MIGRVNQPHLRRFSFPSVNHRQRRNRKSSRQTSSQLKRVLQIVCPGPMEKVSNRCRRNQVREQTRNQHSTKLPRRRHSHFPAMAFLFSPPNLAKKKRIPNEPQNPVGYARAENRQPIQMHVHDEVDRARLIFAEQGERGQSRTFASVPYIAAITPAEAARRSVATRLIIKIAASAGPGYAPGLT